MRELKHIRKATVSLWPAFVILFVAAAWHHGWSSYDQKSPTSLAGKVLKYGYDNPHGMIELEVAEDSAWTVVLAPPSRMQRRGLAEEELKVGIAAEVLAYPRKDGTREMRAEWILIDGDTTQLR